MGHKHNGGFVVSPKRIAIIENEIEELFERVENIETQMKKEKEEQLEKLKAELEYAKFRSTLYSSQMDRCGLQDRK